MLSTVIEPRCTTGADSRFESKERASRHVKNILEILHPLEERSLNPKILSRERPREEKCRKCRTTVEVIGRVDLVWLGNRLENISGHVSHARLEDRGRGHGWKLKMSIWPFEMESAMPVRDEIAASMDDGEEERDQNHW